MTGIGIAIAVRGADRDHWGQIEPGHTSAIPVQDNDKETSGFRQKMFRSSGFDSGMARLDLTPVIAVRAADRDRFSNPGHSALGLLHRGAKTVG